LHRITLVSWLNFTHDAATRVLGVMAARFVDQEKVRKNWAQRGFSCALWVDRPGRVWPNFIHDTDELVMVVDGEQEFEMNGKICRPPVGEELLIPAGTRHTARNIGRLPSKWLYGYKR
jgi:mannose-6-phosphate isomerase-like protein (cupin superfamily)